MLGKLSIIGVVAAISHGPHCTVRCKQHSPHGENFAKQPLRFRLRPKSSEMFAATVPDSNRAVH